MTILSEVLSAKATRVSDRLLEKSSDLLCTSWLTAARHRLVAIFVVLVALAGAWLIDNRFNSLPSVYAHLFYGPIFLAALLFGFGGGMLTAVAAAILLLAAPIAAQSNTQGVLTAGFFVLFGASSGYAIDLLRWSLDRRNERFRQNSLTGLPNAVALAEQIDDWISQKSYIGREGFYLAKIRIPNLDQMMSVFRGNSVIRALVPKVAASLRESLPMSPAVYQVHYDRLAVLIPDYAVKNVGELCDKLCAAIPQSVTLDGVDIQTNGRGNVGVARYPTHGENGRELIRASRFALQRAIEKHETYSIFDKVDDDKRRESLQRLGELQYAIDNGQLVFHYQPKLDLRTNAFTSAEALVRWNHPSGELLSPGAFLPIAENTDVITRLSAWALKTAISQLAAWEREGIHMNLGLAVNLSAMDLRSDSTVRTLKELLTLYGVDPARLEIEVTETTIIDDIEAATHCLQQIKALGVRVAVDDFGTGHAGLSQLRDLPVDSLKIDQTFIKDLLSNPKNDVIVRSAIQLGHNLDLQVTAEGVETRDVLVRLRQYGCDVAQGFVLAHPLPEEELRKVIPLRQGASRFKQVQ